MAGFYNYALTAALILAIANGCFCGNLEESPRTRDRREVQSMSATILTELARQFFSNSGQQGVDQLAQTDDKPSMLKRVLGSAIAGYALGNGDSIVNKVMSMFGGGNSGQGSRPSSGVGSGNAYVPSSATSSKTGVSIVESNPNSNRPSSTYDRQPTNDRRPADRDSYGNNNPNIPQSASSSKTGVSLVDSRPSDRDRQSPGRRMGGMGDGFDGDQNQERDRYSPNSRGSSGSQNGNSGSRYGNSDNSRGSSGSRYGNPDDSETGYRGYGGGSRIPSSRVQPPDETDY